jgi:hypothetical protein
MHLELNHLEPAALRLPQAGESCRYRLGALELLLERGRGGYTLLAHDGARSRTWRLGLDGGGSLWFACRLPRFPLRLRLRETVALAPGGRIRGYVTLPLVPQLLWRQPGEPDAALAELLPAELVAEWDAAHGEVAQQWQTPLLQRLPPPGDLRVAFSPVVLRNPTKEVQSPTNLPLRVADADLAVCRGHLLAPACRFRIEGAGDATLQARRAGPRSPA